MVLSFVKHGSAKVQSAGKFKTNKTFFLKIFLQKLLLAKNNLMKLTANGGNGT